MAQNYDFALQWDEQWWYNNRDNPEGFKTNHFRSTRLELVPRRQTIEMLVVEKANKRFGLGILVRHEWGHSVYPDNLGRIVAGHARYGNANVHESLSGHGAVSRRFRS